MSRVTDILGSIKEGLAVDLFMIGETQIKVSTLVVIALIIVTTLLLSRVIQRVLVRLLMKAGINAESSLHLIRKLVHYTLLIGGLVASLQTMGIDLSTLFAAGAVFAVGVGFAMKNIAENFVSGLILLVEQSIKPGDVLQLESEVVRVERIGIRSTLVRTRNEEEVIVPNSILVQSMVRNFTLSDSSYLLGATVGVVYKSDMKKVRQVLEATALEIPFRDMSQEPRILMKEFADSAVVFSVYIWINEPWIARRLGSELNEAIWWALKDAGITIAFPQLDVHFDTQAEQAFAGKISRS